MDTYTTTRAVFSGWAATVLVMLAQNFEGYLIWLGLPMGVAAMSLAIVAGLRSIHSTVIRQVELMEVDPDSSPFWRRLVLAAVFIVRTPMNIAKICHGILNSLVASRGAQTLKGGITSMFARLPTRITSLITAIYSSIMRTILWLRLRSIDQYTFLAVVAAVFFVLRRRRAKYESVKSFMSLFAVGLKVGGVVAGLVEFKSALQNTHVAQVNIISDVLRAIASLVKDPQPAERPGIGHPDVKFVPQTSKEAYDESAPDEEDSWFDILSAIKMVYFNMKKHVWRILWFTVAVLLGVFLFVIKYRKDLIDDMKRALGDPFGFVTFMREQWETTDFSKMPKIPSPAIDAATAVAVAFAAAKTVDALSEEAPVKDAIPLVKVIETVVSPVVAAAEAAAAPEVAPVSLTEIVVDPHKESVKDITDYVKDELKFRKVADKIRAVDTEYSVTDTVALAVSEVRRELTEALVKNQNSSRDELNNAMHHIMQNLNVVSKQLQDMSSDTTKRLNELSKAAPSPPGGYLESVKAKDLVNQPPKCMCGKTKNPMKFPHAKSCPAFTPGNVVAVPQKESLKYTKTVVKDGKLEVLGTVNVTYGTTYQSACESKGKHKNTGKKYKKSNMKKKTARKRFIIYNPEEIVELYCNGKSVEIPKGKSRLELTAGRWEIVWSHPDEPDWDITVGDADDNDEPDWTAVDRDDDPPIADWMKDQMEGKKESLVLGSEKYETDLFKPYLGVLKTKDGKFVAQCLNTYAGVLLNTHAREDGGSMGKWDAGEFELPSGRRELPNTHKDLWVTKRALDGPAVLKKKFFCLPEKGQKVMLVRWSKSGSWVASDGRVLGPAEVPEGTAWEHTCTTEAGDCMGLLVSGEGKIVGFHYSGGTPGKNNLCVPVTSEFLKLFDDPKN